MKKLLLVTGDLATGKSTFSDQLSARYQIPVYHKDSIKEVLGDTIGFANREENLKLSAATMELMFFLFREQTKLQTDLILEANFRQHEIEKLHTLANANGYDVLTLVFRGDDHILHRRYLHRIHSENRHPVHLSTTFEQFDAFSAYINAARTVVVPGNQLTVQADDFAYQTDDALLKTIEAFLI